MRRKLETRNSVCLQNQKSTMTSSDRNGYYLKWREFCLEKIHNFPAAITFYHLQPKSISRRIRRLNLATFGGSPYQLVIVVMQMIKAHKFQGRYFVRNTWHASKLWINTNLPQAIDFKSRLASVNEANSFRISQLPSQRSYSVSDVLAIRIVEVKTIRELVDCMGVINLLNYFSI
ncbi:uncharacterized protein [Nicotiana sylvestris]|uniref:Uncharacterized protein LOC104215464 isoform X1 n=1 Tax=Nicotiana sylvestris TaxID=4096 RepID=A0A1U7VB34_NICSY|nr:PREDICTED: uncharacterized protein LOC104215464 isoform X1 [Nicotiana sylvestris]